MDWKRVLSTIPIAERLHKLGTYCQTVQNCTRVSDKDFHVFYAVQKPSPVCILALCCF